MNRQVRQLKIMNIILAFLTVVLMLVVLGIALRGGIVPIVSEKLKLIFVAVFAAAGVFTFVLIYFWQRGWKRRIIGGKTYLWEWQRAMWQSTKQSITKPTEANVWSASIFPATWSTSFFVYGTVTFIITGEWIALAVFYAIGVTLWALSWQWATKLAEQVRHKSSEK